MKALVTGGGGFLGSRIAGMLRDRGDQVVVLGRRGYPHLEAAGIKTVQADIRDKASLLHAFSGMDAVFHVAAVAGIWGRRRLFHDINVVGTSHVIEACRSRGVKALVFTSSPSVVFGREPLCGVDESTPYPSRYLAYYPQTKALAERMVLDASGTDLATVAIRPHLIFGPGDPHLIPRVIARAKAGRFIRVGDGRNLVDVTYVDNAAEAHLLAADRLRSGGACAGRAYFLSQGEPVFFWPWIDEILAAVGAPRVTRSVSYRTARTLGASLEAAYRLFGITKEPVMTRFLAAQLATSHYFDLTAARRDLGYEPRVSTEEGVRRLVASYTGCSTRHDPRWTPATVDAR